MVDLLRRFAAVVIKKLNKAYAYLSAPVSPEEESLAQGLARKVIAWSIKQVIRSISRHQILFPPTQQTFVRSLQLLADELMHNTPRFYPPGGPA